MYKAIEALSEPLGSFKEVIASNIRLSNLQQQKEFPTALIISHIKQKLIVWFQYNDFTALNH